MQGTGRIVAVAAACALAGVAAPVAEGAAPTFGTASSTNVNLGRSMKQLVVTDFGNDADPDALISGEGEIQSFRGAAGATFARTASVFHSANPTLGEDGVALARLDPSLDLQVVTSMQQDNLFLARTKLTGAGTLGVTDVYPTSGYRGGPFVMEDFNQDGDPDIAVLGQSLSSPSTSAVVVRKGGAGAALDAGATLSTLADRGTIRAGQLNAGSDPDLVVTHPTSNRVQVYRGSTGVAFSAPLTYTTGPKPRDVAIGSLNGDAYPDFALVYSTGLSFFFGKADGTFTSQAFPDDYDSLEQVRIADFDGDGFNDVLLTDDHHLGPRAVVLAGKGDGTFANVLTKSLTGVPADFEVADLNADRAPDLVQLNPDTLKSIPNTTPRADVAVKLTAPATATTTADATFTLAATNLGPTSATSVVATLSLPSSLSFKSSVTGCSYSAIGRQVTCTIGTLASGATASRNVIVRATATGQTATSAKVTSARGDFNRSNNVAIGLTKVN